MPANPIGVALRGRRAGHHTLAWARPDLQAPENFTLTSPAFGHGAPIPDKHRGRLFGANISPALSWTQPPPGTAELVLIVQDPDVPFGKAGHPRAYPRHRPRAQRHPGRRPHQPQPRPGHPARQGRDGQARLGRPREQPGPGGWAVAGPSGG
jgi:hypothetical protein